MGFDVEKFVSNVEDEKKCKLCLGVLDNPVRTPCGHVFCSGCILPWVVRHGCCPKRCPTDEDLCPADLEAVLPLRQLILDMQVKCEFAELGCQSVVPLTVLVPHSQDCTYRPVPCRNPGCPQTVSLGQLVAHETDECDWRPVGICQRGCGLVLLQRSATAGHECVEALKCQIGEQEIRTGSLETEMRRLQSRFMKREKSLLAQIATLHGNVQLQALKFQQRLNSYRLQLQNISLLYYNNNNNNNNNKTNNNNNSILYNNNNKYNEYSVLDNTDDDRGGGDGGDDGHSHVEKPEKSSDNVPEEIIISRVTEGGIADKKGLKLHDQILKVNGQDLSQSTHEEAVEAFRTAKEPIVVEVLRRGNKTKMKSRSPTMVSVGTQTEEEIFCSNGSPPTPPPPGFYAYNGTGLYQPASRRPVAFSLSADMGLTDIEMAHAYEFEDTYFDDDRSYDMECEEVILHRNSNEKLGLTLCYGSLDDDMTDIFIGEVENESIAAKDGRIRPGDQILQINGIELHGRNQAIKLFTETTADICLLVARHQIQLDDGFMEEHNIVLDDILEERHHEKIQFMINQEHMEEEGATTDTGTTENSSHKLEKDSGVGRTDESTKNEESSEQENFDADSLQYGPEGELHKSRESFTSTEQDFNGHDIPVDVCERFREVLEDRCASPRKDRNRKDSQGSIDRELAMLNKEMEEIQMECQELVRAHMREQQKIQLQQRDMQRSEPHRSPRIVPRMGTRLEYIKHSGLTPHEQAELIRKEMSTTPKLIPQTMKVLDKEKDPATTSAYNTGESCRSTPLTLELNQVSDDSEKGLRNSMLCLIPPGHRTSGSDTEKQTQTPTKPHEHSSDDSLKFKKSLSFGQNSATRGPGPSANLKSCESMGESLQDLYMRYADVMYTNHANLEHTIAIQQKLFQQQLEQKSRIKGQVGAGIRGPDGRQAEAGPGAQSSDGCQMEWVVKRRPDGTRYITRRPIRNKMLKERAKKISEERAGMTTDDEAMSELKVGRYWPKEERKKHIEKARDQKRKKELMLKAKMETLKEEDKKEVNILELSHRKMMKHKGKKVLDDFVTVQEMLAHGSRVADGKSYNPLLSVTTV